MLKFTRYAILLALLSLALLNGQVVSASRTLSPATPLPITHGAHIRPAFEYGQEILAFNNLVQKDIAVVMYFLDWSGSQYTSVFDSYLVSKIQDTFGANGPAIMLTWQPTNGRAPNCTKNYSGAIPLNDIIAGACDLYITKFAQALKARPERFILRFAHEMNISDSPWWPGHFGQNAAAYVQAYQHVYQVFTAQEVPNVEWIWSPNYQSNPVVAWNDRNNYYPGDAYVDWIGVSGYNWNTGGNWMTFSDIYDSAASNYVLKDFACRYAKPQIIAEIGSVEGVGGAASKAAWINDAYQKMPQFPFLRGVVWFNDYAYASPSGADFRVTSTAPVLPLPTGSNTWTDAYRQAISSADYAAVLPTLAQATPLSTYCGVNLNTHIFLPFIHSN